jgi:hypothetical protein
MKNLKITILFLAVLLCSCNHYYYVANVQNIPLFREKKEYRFSGIYAFGDESNCIEVQTAYSLSDKIGIIANYMSARGGDVSGKNYGKGNYFDGGVGYYKAIKNHGVFEIYGGLGGSTQHHEYTSNYYHYYEGKSDLSFIKLYVQPSFGLTFNLLDIAASARICRLSFTNVYYSNYLNDNLRILSDKSHLFLEPSITLRGGWKNIKVQVQASYARYLNSPILYIGEEAHLSIGLYFMLAERFK